MPGTIQVSILELVGIPSVQSSSMGIKVTVGKQAHEAQGKGDFSFPLASFRDNLNVSVCDSEGNEIATTDVETRSIVEKGTWDDLFALEGGGQVRMRLQFVLNEDETKRIRTVRENATRRKLEDILRRRHSIADLANASGGSRASYQDSLRTIDQAERVQNVNVAENPVSKSSAGTDTGVLNKVNPSQRRLSTPAFTTSRSAEELNKLVTNRAIKEVIQPQDQGSLDKTSSNNNNNNNKEQGSLDKTPNNNNNKDQGSLDKTPSNNNNNNNNKDQGSLDKTPSNNNNNNNKDQGSLDKTPSNSNNNNNNKTPSNVRKMVLAFETNPVKELAPAILKTRSVPQTSSTMMDAPVRLLGLKRSIGANAKPAPIPETTDKETVDDNIETQSAREEEQKEDKQDLRIQNNSTSSKKDVEKMEPTREEENEKLENRGYMSNEIDKPEEQPSREEWIKEGKKELKPQNLDYMSSKKDAPEVLPIREEQKEDEKDITRVQPNREEQREEEKDLNLENLENMDLNLENLENMSRDKDMPEMQPIREEQKEEKKDITEVQPTREGRREEEKDLNLQNLEYMSRNEDMPEMEPSVEDQKEESGLEIQNVDYLLSKNDTPRMQPTREERNEEKNDAGLQNVDYMSIEKDLPETQPVREEVKEGKKDVKLEDIDYISSTTDIPGIQPAREDQTEDPKSPKKLHLSPSTAESCRLSWGTLVQVFPSRSQSCTDISTEPPQEYNKVKSNTSSGNVNYTASGRFHEWIFLDEMMIGSCIPSDDMQFIDLLEGRLSISSLGTDQGKLADGELAPKKDEKKSAQQKSVDSDGGSNDRNPKRPLLGQVINIAIMVGFGVFVFLTRQRR